jgi:hypothetical protein
VKRRTSATTAAVSLALLAAVVAAAFAAAGCGGSTSTADLAPFVGRWERVEAGAPNADFTLEIERNGDTVRLTFTNHTNSMSQTVTGTAQAGGIACTLPNATGGAPPGSPAPGVPARSDLVLSLDDDGQLIVDLVLSDGTLEPIWIYQRADGASPSSSDGMSPSAAGTV